MAARKAFLLRLDPDTFDAVQRWADDDLRSINGQIEFLLRRMLREQGRLGGRERPGRPRTVDRDDVADHVRTLEPRGESLER